LGELEVWSSAANSLSTKRSVDAIIERNKGVE
jgi:hypothetical protein